MARTRSLQDRRRAGDPSSLISDDVDRDEKMRGAVLPSSRAAGQAAARSGSAAVARPGLFEALAAAARVTQISRARGQRQDVSRAHLDRRGGPVRRRRLGHGRPQGSRLAAVLALRAGRVARHAPGIRAGRRLDRRPGPRRVEHRRRGCWRSCARSPSRSGSCSTTCTSSRAARRWSSSSCWWNSAPAPLRLILLTRVDLPLGLHRLRLEGRAHRAAQRRPALHARRGARLAAKRPGRGCRTRRWMRWSRAPKAGPRACASPRCRSPATRTRSASPRSSRAASARWPSTCWPRCSTASRPRSRGCCCAPRSWSACAARSPTG